MDFNCSTYDIFLFVEILFLNKLNDSLSFCDMYIYLVYFLLINFKDR